MSKTNFKCMYLVDDRFYKKAIEANTIQNHSAPPSTTLSKNFVYIPTHVNDEIETFNAPIHYPKQLDQQRISQAETHQRNQTPPQNSIYKSSVQSDQIIPEASSSSSRKEDQTVPSPDHMMSEPLPSRQKSMEIGEPLCTCKDTCNSSLEQNDKVHEKRLPDFDVSSVIGELKKKTQDHNEDPELAELRERFRKIKEDIDYPPPKTESLTRKDKIVDKKTIKLKNMKMPLPHTRKKFIAQISDTKENRKVTYVCTICRAKFRRMDTLTRHMQNIHGEFFEVEGKTEKRKNMNDSPQQRKKFISDGRRKRNMIGGENTQKRARNELKCPLCQDHFKSESALNRHGVNVHDLNSNEQKGEKRKEFRGKNLPQQYIKRQKNEIKTPIEYVNYF